MYAVVDLPLEMPSFSAVSKNQLQYSVLCIYNPCHVLLWYHYNLHFLYAVLVANKHRLVPSTLGTDYYEVGYNCPPWSHIAKGYHKEIAMYHICNHRYHYLEQCLMDNLTGKLHY